MAWGKEYRRLRMWLEKPWSARNSSVGHSLGGFEDQDADRNADRGRWGDAQTRGSEVGSPETMSKSDMNTHIWNHSAWGRQKDSGTL